MIITCPNCKKQFKIDVSLIPKAGRDLQCGSCNHVWFHKIEEEKKDILNLNEKNVDLKIESQVEIKEEKNDLKKEKPKKIKEKLNNQKEVKKIQRETASNVINKTNNKNSKFFSYLIVFILSFIALIVLLDTLKTPLIKVFPGLEILLFNLFETLQDIKLFIIDLT